MERLQKVDIRKRPASDEIYDSSSDSSDNEKRQKGFQRAGKWTTEEESFAMQLIVSFEKGILSDCEEGCTLRAYLARRLNCAPMRISKKFAGRCIGKLAFARKESVTETEESLQSKLKSIEQLYHESFRTNETKEKCNPYENRSSAESSSLDSNDESGSLQSSDEEVSKLKRRVSQIFQTHFDGETKTIPQSLLSSRQILSAYDLFTLAMEKSASNSNLSDLSSSSHSLDQMNGSSEADEWRDVLSFFCGDESGFRDPSMFHS